MVALVVLNYNDYETTSRFVNLIHDYTNIGKIIIVDNCSTDDSYERLSELRSEKTDVLQTEENRGYASGNNVGVRYAIEQYCPEYIIISNPDVEFAPEIVDILKEKAALKPDLGIITCMMNCTSGIRLKSAWRQPRYRDYLIGNLPVLNRLLERNRYYSAEELKEEIVKVDAVPGSFFMITARAYTDIDGLDEDTFLYCEESILAARLHQKGYQNYLVTTAEYVHRHSVSINKNIQSLRKRLKLRQKSREVYCVKYLHAGKSKILLLRIAFYIGLIEYSLSSRIKILLKAGRRT